MSATPSFLAGKRVLCVISRDNAPRAGEIEAALRDVTPDLSCVAPDSLQTMEQAVRGSSRSADVVIAMGGDGTLHRVLQWIDLDTQVLGLLPGGTGNDLARSLGYPADLPGRVAHLAALQPRAIDLGLMSGVLSAPVRFHNCAGIGLDAATLAVREARHGLFRRNYKLAAALAIFGMKRVYAQLDLNGSRIGGAYWWVVAMNNLDIGKGMRAAPQARIDDGLLDMLLIEDIPKERLLSLLPQAEKGQHVGKPGIIYRQAAAVSCVLEVPIERAAIDGELYPCFTREVSWTVIPGGLTLLRPAG